MKDGKQGGKITKKRLKFESEFSSYPPSHANASLGFHRLNKHKEKDLFQIDDLKHHYNKDYFIPLRNEIVFCFAFDVVNCI